MKKIIIISEDTWEKKTKGEWGWKKQENKQNKWDGKLENKGNKTQMVRKKNENKKEGFQLNSFAPVEFVIH
jgi:hypothetical protein